MSYLGNWPLPWLANLPPSFASKLPGLSPPLVSILKSRSNVPLWIGVGLLKVCWRTCWGSSLLPPLPHAASSSAATSASVSEIRARMRVKVSPAAPQGSARSLASDHATSSYPDLDGGEESLS